ncbi:MAG: hypothetical protein RQ760_20715, partial [Sedimentisphaerales bacterium]|nr:hypothetical protein [Sedimentisphaerales bacterium]
MRSRVITLIIILILPTLGLSKDVPHSSTSTSRLHVINPKNPQGLRKLFQYTGESLHLVSAHRGGPQKNFPENCIETFENTLQHT